MAGTDPARSVERWAAAPNAGRSALLLLPAGGSGLVFALGDKWVARRFSARSALRVSDTAGGLRLGLSEFGAPTVAIALADPAARRQWREQLTSAPERT